MNTPKIIAYLKPSCGWSQGVRAIMRKYRLLYEDRDILNDASFYTEMIRKSGQSLSPCVEIDGHMLADVSGDEVEAYLLRALKVQPTAAVADAPTNRACDAHHHKRGKPGRAPKAVHQPPDRPQHDVTLHQLGIRKEV